MTDPRTLIERELERVEPTTVTLDGFHRRRARKHRNGRIAAGGVAIAIAAAGIAFAIGALRATDTSMPADAHGGSIVFLDHGNLLLKPAGDGPVRPLVRAGATLQGPGGTTFAGRGVQPVFAWSPDGTRVAFAWGDLTEHEGSTSRWDMVFAADVLEGKTEFVNSCGGSPRGVCTEIEWSPEGDEIAWTLADGTLWVTRVGSQSGSNVAARVRDFAWSPDGHELAIVRSHGEVRVVEVTSPSAFPSEPVAQVSGSPGPLAWSPDGTTLLVTDSADSSEGSDVIIAIDRRTGRETTIVDGGRDRFLAAEASWSPDGTLITWAAFPGRRSFGGPGSPFAAEIWVANADGSNAHRIYVTGCCVAGMTEHAFTGPAFSPDGTSIAFSVIGDREDLPNDTGVVVVNIDGTNVRQVSPTGIFPAWQPLPEEG
jgi:Tol biopolymer transport system component